MRDSVLRVHTALFVFLAFSAPVLVPLFPVRVAPEVSAVHIPNPAVHSQWDVYWEATPHDGVRIYNVTYKGTLVLRDARIPGIIITYYGSGCFFYDQFQISHSDIYIEDINRGTLDPSDEGFQIRADYYVPGYEYIGIWRFYPDGRLLAYIEIWGPGCYAPHVYEVRFRFDFAIVDDHRNAFYHYTDGNWSPAREEHEFIASGNRDPSKSFTNWKVASGKRAYYFTPFDSLQSPWAQGVALVVQSHPGEMENSFTPGVVTPYIYRGVVIYDSDNDNTYDPDPDGSGPLLGEPIMPSTTVPGGMALEDDPKVKYYDADGNNLWNSGEVAVYDSNGNGKFDPGEPTMFGTAPAFGTLLKDDPKFKSTPSESIWRKDLVVWYMSRQYYNPLLGPLTQPILTGAIFYPSGF